jgi:vacuolar-type H+-ATPase subunit H
MDKDEIIRKLKHEEESLKACIKELEEAQLAKYTNTYPTTIPLSVIR